MRSSRPAASTRAGSTTTQTTYAEAELYHPGSGTWSHDRLMAEPRYGQAAALLPGTGWVLVTGGTERRHQRGIRTGLGPVGADRVDDHVQDRT